MYNQNNSPHWEPLNFRDFSSTSSNDLMDKQANRLTESCVIQQPAVQVTSQLDPTLVEQEFERLKAEITAQAYQEGLALGKEAGFTAGKEAGYEQGYQLGQQEGKEHIYQQLEQQVNEEKMNAVQSIANLAANFQKAINEIDEMIVPKLTNLALAAAQKIVGDLPKTKQKQLTQSIQSLINQFPPLSEQVQLHVNPDDIASVETLLTDELNKCGWKLVADPLIESGGCKIVSDKNEIDATVASKWQVVTDCVDGDNT